MSQFRPEFSDCDRGLDAGAYVLRAMDDGESRAYAAHLAHCDHCRVEVDDLRLVVDTLPIAAPQTAPSPVLRSRIMSVVNAEAELLRAAGPEADRVPAAAKSRSRFRLPAWHNPMRPAFAGALACALLGLGLLGGVVVEGNTKPKTRTLNVTAAAPTRAHLVETGDKAAFEVTKMPSLSEGQVYQVWFDYGDGRFRPTHTLFNVRSDGRARVAIDESVKGVQRIAVTAEKSGGSTSPTSDPVITAQPA